MSEPLKTEFVVRSELDGGEPGIRYDDRKEAEELRDKLNNEYGLPNDHRVTEEEQI